MKEKIISAVKDSVRVKEAVLKSQTQNIERAASVIIDSLKKGGKVLLFGNGGSAADSQHIAAELVGRFKAERKALAAIALSTDTSAVTAIANDYGYNTVFARQVEALGKSGDVAIGISTSGNSANVIAGLKKAGRLGLRTIALAGGNGGKMKGAAEVSIIVASKDTPRVQESHIMIGHILCGLIEDAACGK
jgi:D-sedoheptulose 7-phosphate isomerase